MTYYVRGGVYTGTDFTTIEDGTVETYGPFTNRDDAFAEWSARARAKIDICCHRLTIDEIEEASQAPLRN